MTTNEYKFDHSTVIKRIKEKRKEKKMTQEQLAQKVGRTRQWLVNIEKGERIPSLEDAVNIANALECDLLYLCGYQEKSYWIYQKITDEIGLSEKAIKGLNSLKNEPVISTLIESLLTKEYKDYETGKKEVGPSPLLWDLKELCTRDYGPINAKLPITVHNIYNKEEYAQLIKPSEVFKMDEQQLYSHLCKYIESERTKRGLSLYDFRDEKPS